MSAPQILILPKGDRSGRLIARLPGTSDVQVGQVLLASLDGQPEQWKAWLWTAPSQYPPPTRSCEAMTRESTAELETVLNGRIRHEGQWWA